MSDSTFIMTDEDKHRARQRSLVSIHPPLRVQGYEQEQFLGKGAYGEVWVAVDTNSSRPVAIKFYNRGPGLDWSMMAREVDKLRHLFTDRYVVQLLSVGWDSDPPYFVMEYMENGSLEDILRQGPIPPEEAVRFFREILIGLGHAHGRGILHCDLKPANILLDQDRKPRLADFGQARLQHEQTASLGTLYYMAPEQADLYALPDARWDVYALGAILYRMLAGEVPYGNAPGSEQLTKSGPVQERLRAYRQLITKAPVPTAHTRVPGVDKALAAIVTRCLSVNPRDRFPNVQAILDALKARSLRRARRPLLVLGAVAPFLVALVMALAAGVIFRSMAADTEGELIRRALESNRFAAQSVADSLALSIDKRWRILEAAAADPEFQRRLKQIVSLKIGSPEREAVHVWLHKRLDKYRTDSDAQFSADLKAVSWFVNDRTGLQVGRSPPAPDILNRNWSFRDYFHGLGRDFAPEEVDKRDLPPLREPHRSVVFRSRHTKTLMAAFSVPVWDLPSAPGNASTDPSTKEPIGVIAMTGALGHFGNLEGTRNQFAAIVDTRVNEEGLRGMVVEHPDLQKFTPPEGQEGWYVDEDFLDRAKILQEQKKQALRLFFDSQGKETSPPGTENTERYYPGTYIDPVEGVDARRWLASLDPVLVSRGRNEILDTGWIVVVQERTNDTVKPVQSLTGKLIRGGLVALGIVVAVVTSLWGVVMFLLHDPTRPGVSAFWRRLGVSGSTGTGSKTSGSQPHSHTPSNPSERASKPTVATEERKSIPFPPTRAGTLPTEHDE